MSTGSKRFGGKAGVGFFLAVLLAALLWAPAAVSAQAVACERLGTLFGCPSTFNDASGTVTCPGTTRNESGKLKSFTATEFAPTEADSRARSAITARREAERIARERALAKCSGTSNQNSTHTLSIRTVELGPCAAEGRFFGCAATAQDIVVKARCTGKRRTVSGRLGAMTATEFATAIPEAQARARATASREGERVALERARARLRC